MIRIPILSAYRLLCLTRGVEAAVPISFEMSTARPQPIESKVSIHEVLHLYPVKAHLGSSDPERAPTLDLFTSPVVRVDLILRMGVAIQQVHPIRRVGGFRCSFVQVHQAALRSEGQRCAIRYGSPSCFPGRTTAVKCKDAMVIGAIWAAAISTSRQSRYRT